MLRFYLFFIFLSIKVDKQERRLVKVTKEHVSDCKKLLNLMGIPFVEAESEAEAQCAQMAQAGLVHAVATEDMDALTFKGNSPILRVSRSCLTLYRI